MRDLFTKETLVLVPGLAVSGIAARPATLRVLQGRIWVTVEGIGHDYWLSAGDTFSAQPGRLVVVEGDRAESRVEIIAAQRAPAASAAGARLRSAAQGFFRRRRQPDHAPACAGCETISARR